MDIITKDETCTNTIIRVHPRPWFVLSYLFQQQRACGTGDAGAGARTRFSWCEARWLGVLITWIRNSAKEANEQIRQNQEPTGRRWCHSRSRVSLLDGSAKSNRTEEYRDQPNTWECLLILIHPRTGLTNYIHSIWAKEKCVVEILMIGYIYF